MKKPINNPTIICPYCKKLIEYYDYYKEWGDIGFECLNHKNIYVHIMCSENPLNIRFILIHHRSNIFRYIQIIPDYQICLIDEDKPHVFFPFDPNLTPENFEQKLKTYITFQ